MADTEQQAMTSERLAELTRKHDAAIDALWESAEDVYRDDYMDARSLWFELLAEVERLRTAQRELAEKLDAETDYSAGRIESLLKRCAVQRHRAHVAEQQRDAAMKVVRAVAEAGVDDDSSGGTWLMFAGYDAETVREQARALVASAGDGEPQEQAAAEQSAGNIVANFPTVMNILDAALTGDAEKARSYAGLLADRYETQGRPRWADRVRRRLAPDYDPGPTYYLADADKQGEVREKGTR